MPERVLVVLTNPVEGREDEFNEWYTQRHLADVLDVPGFVSVQRLRLRGEPIGGQRWKYCALYKVEHEAPEAAVEEMLARVGGERMPMSDAMDEAFCCALYEPFVERSK